MITICCEKVDVNEERTGNEQIPRRDCQTYKQFNTVAYAPNTKN